MSGPTPFSQDGLPLFTEERPAVVILGDLLDYIQEMRRLYDDTQELYKVLQDNLSFIGSGSPKGVYASLSALQTAKPTGDSFIYVTTDNGNWNYWNGTGWVSGGQYQTTVVSPAKNATNLINNPNFTSTSFWDAVSTANGTLTASNNELLYNVVGLVSSSRIQQNGVYTPVVGHKYYVRGDIFPKVANTSYISFGGVDSSILPTANAWNKINRVVTAINTTAFRYYHPTNTGYVAGDVVKFRKMMVVDLTVLYGANNEPSLAEFEQTLTKFPESFFENTIELTPSVFLTEKVLNDKVDKIVGKGLSTNDFTNSDRDAVRTISKLQVRVSDFENLRKAVESITNASESNQYEILIDEGTHDLMTMYTQAEIENTSFVGLTIQNWVSLKGTGSKEKTIIKMEIPETWQLTTIQRVAPVAYQGNGGMENVTIIGRNARYTVHDDYGYPNAQKLFKNCTFKKLAGLGNSQAWGEGSFSGMRFEFIDCDFITEYNQASYSSHNNDNFSRPTTHLFRRCKFINNGGYFGVRFITLNSGQTENLVFEDCYMDGVLKFEEYQPSLGCRYDLFMSGSSSVPILIDATNGTQPVYNVINETKIIKNGDTSTIAKGTPVMFNNDGSVVLKLGANNKKLMVGIALQDIPVNEKGTIKTAGYLVNSDLSLTLSKGDEISIENGVIVKSNTNPIGISNRSGFVKLY